MLGKMFAGLLGGFVVGAFAYLVLGLVDLPAMRTHLGPIPLGALWASVLLVAVAAGTAGQAWRWMLLLAGLLAFALPFLGFVAGGNRLDPGLPGRIGDLLVLVLASDLLPASIGPEPAETAHAWLMALDGQVFALASLGLGTLLLVTGLMVGKETRHLAPTPAPGDALAPGVLNVITAKRGTHTYHVYAHRALSEEEMIQLVRKALEDGRLAEPEHGGTATLITHIGLDTDATRRSSLPPAAGD